MDRPTAALTCGYRLTWLAAPRRATITPAARHRYGVATSQLEDHVSTVPPHDRDDRDSTAAPDEAAATEGTSASENATNTESTRSDHAGAAPKPSEPTPPPPPAPSTSEPTTTLGTEPATRQLPTEDEDTALRQERARRFGRNTGEPTSEPAPPTAAPPATPVAPAPVQTEPAPAEDDPFGDWDDGPRSRAAAHWWGILIAIVFAPVAWYLLADGGERIAFSLDRNLEAVNVAGLVELAGGLLCAIVLLLAARWSSVGSIIVGSIGTVIGAAFLAVPVIVNDFLNDQSAIFDRLGQFGTNVYDHLISEGHAGRLLLYGVVLIFLGIVSHGARRQGRREERRKIAAEV